MNEFDYIINYLKPLDKDNFIGDDAAIILHDTTVIAKDLLIEEVHFLKNHDPCLLAQKALRVNLSDIAAMGAKPYGYLLGLALPTNITNQWWQSFSSGLKTDNDLFKIKLLGGDTTNNKSQNIVISITMIGIKTTKFLTRSGAQVGDKVFVSGTLGDAALGLLAYKGKIDDKSGYLKMRYDLPQPRVQLGQKIASIASSCIDISDGLAQDAQHICTLSNVGMAIYNHQLPISESAKYILTNYTKYQYLPLNGGDDYELLFTVAPNKINELNKIKADLNAEITCIGEVINGKKVKIYHYNKEIFLKESGFNHKFLNI